MSRRKRRTRRKPPPERLIVIADEWSPVSEASGCWGLIKAVLSCGLSGGLVGAAIDAAFLTDGYALPAAMIGGIPLGVVGACALGWYGWLFGFMNRLRNGLLVGVALGLLGGGTLGMVAGLSIWAFAWSIPSAIAGAAIQWALPGRGPRTFGLVPGIMAGALVGILMQAVWTGPVYVMTDASDGAIVGAVLGVLLIPALLAWLDALPDLLRRRRRVGSGR